MQGYKLDHKKINFRMEFDETTKRFQKRPYLTTKVNLERLYARTPVSYNREGYAQFDLVNIGDTPHNHYIQGKKKIYQDYLNTYGKTVGYGIEHSLKAFDEIISDDKRYLEEPYSARYIMAETVKAGRKEKIVILDGVHRASILFS